MFLALAAVLLLSASQANAQYYRGQIGGNQYIYPDGTIAYNLGQNNYRSGYYYIPPVNYGYYGGQSNYNFNSMGTYNNRYYVPPNGQGGGGYYSNVPAYNGSTYGR
jgi:hypothetical protein